MVLYVIGIGPGDPDYVLPAAVKAARNCQVLIGGQRALTLFSDLSCAKFQVTGNLSDLRAYLAQNLALDKCVGVLVSGDTGFFSLLPFLRHNFPEIPLQVVPGISSLQLAFARAGLPWQGAVLTSVHGRPLEQIDTSPARMIGMLTGKHNSPQLVAQYFLDRGPNRRTWLGNNLSYVDEVWLDTDLQSLAADESKYLNSVLIIMPAEDS